MTALPEHAPAHIFFHSGVCDVSVAPNIRLAGSYAPNRMVLYIDSLIMEATKLMRNSRVRRSGTNLGSIIVRVSKGKENIQWIEGEQNSQ